MPSKWQAPDELNVEQPKMLYLSDSGSSSTLVTPASDVPLQGGASFPVMPPMLPEEKESNAEKEHQKVRDKHNFRNLPNSLRPRQSFRP